MEDEVKFMPIDEATHMVLIVTTQRDQVVAQLNDVQMENYRLRKVIDALTAQVQELTKVEEVTPGEAT